MPRSASGPCIAVMASSPNPVSTGAVSEGLAPWWTFAPSYMASCGVVDIVSCDERRRAIDEDGSYQIMYLPHLFIRVSKAACGVNLNSELGVTVSYDVRILRDSCLWRSPNSAKSRSGHRVPNNVDDIAHTSSG